MKTLFVIISLAAFTTSLPAEAFIVSDLARTPPEAPEWEWEYFADTVMGGNSEIAPPLLQETGEGKALLLAGRVVTRGGGFIQVRLKYQGRNFDASDYSGVEIELSAPEPGSYFVFLRTRDNIFPWSYYSAPAETTAARTIIRIPWSEFSAQSTLRRSVRPQRLTSIALTAAFEDFNAYLNIYRVGLYR
jgi:hypothetical protein